MTEQSIVQAGMAAPGFALPAIGGKANAEGQVISLEDFRGKQVVVLYFYPKDQTPGCTSEACDFRDRSADLTALGTIVLGVSPDSVKSHGKFIEKQQLNFPLLADEGHKVCEAYGVWAQKSMAGHKYMGVERSTFVIDRQGQIAQAWRKVKVTGHVDEVIEAVRKLG